MDDLKARMRRLGEAVAKVSDSSADRGAVERARRAFVVSHDGAAVDAGRPKPRRATRATSLSGAPRWVLPLAAALCALAIVFGVRFTRRAHVDAPREAEISFTAGGVPGAVGDWVAAGAAAPLDVRFTDGTVLALSPEARMRVTTTSASGADVLIERGRVHASVQHPQGHPARWTVRAGPFEVHVTGTTFDASWDPMAETFELTMLEGVVSVSGPHIPPGRSVVAGERLVVSVRDQRMVLTMGETPKPLVPESATSEVKTAAPPQKSDPPPQKPTSEPLKPVVEAKPAWKDLAAAGKYREAFAAIDFTQEMERAGSAGDLLLLADTARFAGSPARAREALLAARKRFGAKGRSAFLLGKIAADQLASPGEAVGWFDTYLREDPGGPLAEQALGRIVDLTRRSSPEAARQAASRYLARYPEGSYAALARSLVAP